MCASDPPTRRGSPAPRLVRIAAGVLIAWCAAQAAGAQQPQGIVTLVLTSPPSPVGAGARATAVGSAFVAVADDATAASWNPAGLIQLERPEISLVGLGSLQVDRVGTVEGETPSQRTVVDVGTDTTGTAALNYASAVLPFSFRGRNIVTSVNYQQMLSFDRSFSFKRVNSFESKPENDRITVDSEQSGGIYALSPALAVELTPELSLGAALNYWFDGIARPYAWRRESRVVSEIGLAGGMETFRVEDRDTFDNVRGVNGTFGLLYRHASGVSAGAFVELPFQARFTLTRATQAEDRPFERGKEALTMDLPLSWGFGLAWRPTDRWTLSGDATVAHWSDFRIHDSSGQSFVVTGDLESAVEVDDVVTIRLGLEHVVPTQVALLSLRLGAFRDPEPSRGAPEDFWGVATGLGVTFEDLSIDFAYQLRFGLDVSGVSTLNALFQTPDDEMNIFQNSFYLSAVYYF